jgi:hypothetical protein
MAKIHAQVQNPSPTFAISSLSSADRAYDLYHLAIKGVTSKKIYQQFVILNITASPLFSFVESFNYNNVDKISTTAQMAGESGADTAGIPLAEFTFNNTDGDPVFNYGWLKYMPSCTRTTGGKRVFTATWEYGLWPELLYPMAG